MLFINTLFTCTPINQALQIRTASLFSMVEAFQEKDVFLHSLKMGLSPADVA